MSISDRLRQHAGLVPHGSSAWHDIIKAAALIEGQHVYGGSVFRIFDGGQYCDVECSACDGCHHWIPGELENPESPARKAGFEVWYECKHCRAWTPDHEEE